MAAGGGISNITTVGPHIKSVGNDLPIFVFLVREGRVRARVHIHRGSEAVSSSIPVSSFLFTGSLSDHVLARLASHWVLGTGLPSQA